MPFTELPTHFVELQDTYGQTVGSGQRSLAITSAEGGEGVTMVAVALARRAAEGQRKTLLVDMNLSNPMLHTLFGRKRLEWNPDDEASWRAAMQPIGDDGNLTLLTAPAESGSHWSFRDRTALSICLASWHADFECVVVDTSPVNRHNARNIPTATVCGAMGGTLMVVLAARTPENKLVEALEQLTASDSTLLGSIINDRHLPGLASELCRETYRLNGIFPRTMASLRKRIRGSTLLNTKI